MIRLKAAACSALLALFLVPAARAETGAFDRLLPAETIVYVSLENAARTKQRFQNCSLSALWSHEEMKGFLKAPMEKWAEALEEMKKQSGFSVDQVLDLATGQVAVAATSIDLDEETPKGLVLLADIGDNAAKVREMAGAAEKRFADSYRRTEEEFRGVTFVVYRPEEADGGDAEESDGVREKRTEQPCWFVHEKLFAMALNPETLKQLVARRASGGEGSLGERDLYKRARARTGRSPDFCLWVDGANLIAELRKSEEFDDDDWRIADALGLTAIEGFCIQGKLAPEGVFFDIFMPVRGEKRGILKIFDQKNDVVAPPKWVPADAIVAGTMRFDVAAIYQEVLRVAEAIEAGNAAAIEANLAKAKAAVGVDIKQDVIGSFGTTITTYMKSPDPNAPGAMVPGLGGGFVPLQQAVFAISVTNQQALDGALGKLLAQVPPGFIEEDEYLGVKIRSASFMKAMGMVPAFAVLPDQFVFATRIDDVRELIARYGKDAKSLAETDRFKRALEGMPAERSSVGYDDIARSLRHGSMVQAVGMIPDLKAIFDMDRFPGEETLAQYLGDGASVMQNAEDGVVYRYRIRLKPITRSDED